MLSMCIYIRTTKEKIRYLQKEWQFSPIYRRATKEYHSINVFVLNIKAMWYFSKVLLTEKPGIQSKSNSREKS